jgi:Fe-S-cluster-containing hydrogenase component 2
LGNLPVRFERMDAKLLVARIDPERCDRSPGCPARRVCPRGAIQPILGGDRPGAKGYEVDSARCTGCGVCLRFCPTGALTMDVPLPTGGDAS